MSVRLFCRRKRCIWRNADGFCLMAYECPTGDRCVAIIEQVGTYDYMKLVKVKANNVKPD